MNGLGDIGERGRDYHYRSERDRRAMAGGANLDDPSKTGGGMDSRDHMDHGGRERDNDRDAVGGDAGQGPLKIGRNANGFFEPPTSAKPATSPLSGISPNLTYEALPQLGRSATTRIRASPASSGKGSSSAYNASTPLVPPPISTNTRMAPSNDNNFVVSSAPLSTLPVSLKAPPVTSTPFNPVSGIKMLGRSKSSVGLKERRRAKEQERELAAGDNKEKKAEGKTDGTNGFRFGAPLFRSRSQYRGMKERT
ncbi:hypothetical protein BC829DRAFT_86576 [Chytridium lagenaria]|nr:hypothetical protein BC829DRAFT_86576 [Chytridium lagenaria]